VPPETGRGVVEVIIDVKVEDGTVVVGRDEVGADEVGTCDDVTGGCEVVVLELPQPISATEPIITTVSKRNNIFFIDAI
jgi:hypothetical protein